MEEDFVNIFVLEAEEQIELLEKNLLDLEKDTTNAEVINNIFRVMHTLKGASDMFGFSTIRELTHHLETIYDKVRDKEIDPDKKILDLTFKTIDHLRKLLTDNKLTDEQNIKTHETLLRTASEIVALNGDDEPDYEKDEEKSVNSNNSGKEKFSIIFKANEAMLNRGINILSLFRELAEIGKYNMIELPHGKDEETSVWQIILETERGQEVIEDVFMFVLNDCEISKMNGLNHPIEDDQQTKIVEELNEETTSDKTDSHEVDNSSNIQVDIQETEDLSGAIENNTSKKEIGNQVTTRVNVDAGKLDKLMNLVSELVTTTSQLNVINSQKKYDTLSVVVEKIESLSRQFRDNTLSIRLIPINDLVIRFRRLVRDLSQELNKEVKFITEGTDTELDKNIIDSLAEPLMHILRNAIDHGIELPEERKQKGKPEQGAIKLSAYHAGANVYIQIQDDGAGIDPEKIRIKAIEKGLIKQGDHLSTKEIYDLIFLPGFSTTNEITKISGRGVGMDVVKRRIAEIQGEVSINSEDGLGTIFTIKLHQTISIIDSLMVRIYKSYFLIPNTEIEFCIEEYHHDLMDKQNQRVEFENELIPFIYLRKLFAYTNDIPKKEKLIIVNKEGQRIAIVVDEIIGEHQAVIKPLGQILQSQDFLVGASIMGNGNFAFMLDINKLILKNKNKNKEVKYEYEQD